MGARAIDRLVTATQAIAGDRSKQHHDVLGDFWVKPCVSGETRAAIYATAKDSIYGGMVAEIIARATDESGTLLFVPTDRIAFMKEVSDDRIAEVYNLVKGAGFGGKS